MAASEASITDGSTGVVVDSQQVDDQTAEATVVSDDTKAFESPSDSAAEVSIAGRGASFQAVIQELYTEAFMTGTGTSGDVSVSVSEDKVEENINVAYGICGSSCGQRGFLGESDAATGTASSPGDDFTLSTADGVVGESVDVGQDSICSSNPDQKYDQASLVNRNGHTVCSDRMPYAGSDAPPQPADYKEAKRQGAEILTLPAMIGTVTVSVNLPGVQTNELKLTGELISDMYLQEKNSDASDVEKWNNERIQELNPNVNLPDKSIIPVHRCDGSGTTFAFVDYLGKAASDGWKAKEVFAEGNDRQTGNSGGNDENNNGQEDSGENAGTAATALPTGELLDEDAVCGDGNPGVANTVQDTEFSFGYVEFGLSKKLGLTTARLQNADQTAFVKPTVETAANAAAGADLPRPWGNWSDASITYQSDPAGGNAYPIGTFSYIWLWANPQQANQDKTPVNCENTLPSNCPSSEEDNPAGEDGDLNKFKNFWTKEEWTAVREYLRFIFSDEVQENVNPAAGLAPVPEGLRENARFAINELTPYGEDQTLTTNPQTDGYPKVGQHVSLTGSNALGSSTYSIDNFDARNTVFPLSSATGLDVTTNAQDGSYVTIPGSTILASSTPADASSATGYDTATALDSSGNPFEIVVPNDANCDDELTPGSTTDVTGQVIDNHLVARC